MEIRERIASLCSVRVLTLVTCRNMAKERLVLVAASTSTPMMIPLSIRTAAYAFSDHEANKPRAILTQRVEIEWDIDTLLDMVKHHAAIFRRRRDRLDRQGIQPHANALSVVAP